MRENYRNSIASIKKFPQFTTMHVIDGQAGLIICASLIFYSLTIDNILNIIVLMIISGITVATLMGDNGIIKRAGDAKETQRGAAVQDEVTLAIAENAMIDQLNSVNGGNEAKKEKAKVVEDLLGKGYLHDDEAELLETEDTITIGSITIDFSKLAGEEDTGIGTVSIELTIAGTKVNATTPLKPDNFYYVGGTIDSGYVISDNASDENKYSSSTNVGTDLQGNQFVWVPVEANQKITLKVTSTKEDITGLKLYDPLGEEISLGSVSGKTYNNTNITPTINGGYKAEVTTASGTETKTLVVRSLYAKDTFKDIVLDDEYFLSDEWINIVKGYYGNPETKEELYYRMGGVTTDEQFVTTSKQRHFVVGTSSDGSTTYANSVNTNGGFYIARYEAGATTARTSGSSSATLDSIKTANGTPTSAANQTPYNYITQSQAKGLAESMYTGASFTCTLPTGAAWDRTLGWLVNTNNKTLNQVSVDSKEWGNYSDDTFSNTTGRTNTGIFSQTSANNIFDLAGNVYEWTTEVYGSYLVNRGGFYADTGSYSPSSFRDSRDATDTYDDSFGFRSALFL